MRRPPSFYGCLGWEGVGPSLPLNPLRQPCGPQDRRELEDREGRPCLPEAIVHLAPFPASGWGVTFPPPRPDVAGPLPARTLRRAVQAGPGADEGGRRPLQVLLAQLPQERDVPLQAGGSHPCRATPSPALCPGPPHPQDPPLPREVRPSLLVGGADHPGDTALGEPSRHSPAPAAGATEQRAARTHHTGHTHTALHTRGSRGSPDT